MVRGIAGEPGGVCRDATLDPSAAPDLRDQIDAPFETFLADGAYDGEPVSEAIFAKQPDAIVIVPPHKTAVLSSTAESQRDEHIREIARHG